MGLTYLEVIGVVTVFYIIRHYFDSDYKVKGKKKIIIDIFITVLIAFVLQWMFELIFT